MSEHPEGSTRRWASPGIVLGAALGLATTAGWLLNDMGVYLTSGQPGVALALIPGSLVALVVGAALGALAGLHVALLVPVATAGLAAFHFHRGVHAALVTVLSPLGLEMPGGVLLHYLGLALVLWSAALALSLLAGRAGLPPARTALCLGLLGAIACLWISFDELRPHWRVLAGAALFCALLGWRRVPLRRLATAAVVGAATLFIAYEALAPSRVQYWREDLAPPERSAAGGTAAGDPPDALLVVLDTVRAQSLAPYGYERVTTPRLDAWVSEHATLHEQSRSTSSFTLATHGSLFTGTLPAQHKAARLRPSATSLDPEIPTLAERLRERGYQTAAIVSNTTYLNPAYGMDRGFERFDRREGSLVGKYLPLAQLLGHRLWAGHLSYRDAETITDEAIAWLDERREGEPFFLMLNYLDAHTPYAAPAPHDRLFDTVVNTTPFGMPRKHRQLAYDRNLHYLDAHVGRLLDALEERGLDRDMLIVITSDHGEAFGEHHGFLEHCWTLYEEVVRVPLYVKPPGGRRAERDAEPINSADVLWMMLDELGVPHEGRPSAGGLVAEWYRQIPMTDKYLALSERMDFDLDRDLVAWIEDGRKIIVSTSSEVEAYDLASDPLEQRPLELSREEIDRAVLRALEWWDAHPMSAEQTEQIPPDQMERLRALGYVGQ